MTYWREQKVREQNRIGGRPLHTEMIASLTTHAHTLPSRAGKGKLPYTFSLSDMNGLAAQLDDHGR